MHFREDRAAYAATVVAEILCGIALAWLLLWGPPAAAACACLCVDGQPMTVCESATEVSQTPDLCLPRVDDDMPDVVDARQACPTPEPVDPVTYSDGPTSNCRDREVATFDGSARFVRAVCE